MVSGNEPVVMRAPFKITGRGGEWWSADLDRSELAFKLSKRADFASFFQSFLFVALIGCLFALRAELLEFGFATPPSGKLASAFNASHVVSHPSLTLVMVRFWRTLHTRPSAIWKGMVRHRSNGPYCHGTST
jgi:hypothetical protein